MTEDKMGGWHRQLNGHEFEQALRDAEGQRSLVCYSPWGCKESDTTERLNNMAGHMAKPGLKGWKNKPHLLMEGATKLHYKIQERRDHYSRPCK